MIFVLAAPVGATGAAPPSPWGGPGAAEPALPRDAVLGSPGLAAARISAAAVTSRYPVNDGSGATIAVAVTPACLASCTGADPQAIAGFVGTLVHGPEVELLTVQLSAPFQIPLECGSGAQACYYTNQNRIVVNGNDEPASDGASREFVLAHEYGHHLARHRENPSPFLSPLEWGTARWSSREQVCRHSRAGRLFPGSFGLRYFRDPGEAFAEAYARNRFPESGVRWRWPGFLKPDAAAFRAIRRDALRPWSTRTGLQLGGRLSGRGGATVRTLSTPLDGMVSLRPRGPTGRRYRLSVVDRAGHVLRTYRAGRGGRRGGLNFTVCGQKHLRVQIESPRARGPFKLQVQRP